MTAGVKRLARGHGGFPAGSAVSIPAPMRDRLFFSILAAAAVVTIALASVWPQGYGARSPGPFGHVPIQQTPEMRAAMARAEAAQARKRQPVFGAGAIKQGLRAAAH